MSALTAIKQNAIAIHERIEAACRRAGRPVSDVAVVAVTKQVSVERAREAVEAGFFHLGENRPEGLLEKAPALSDLDVRWHYIGSLQTRKVKQVIGSIDALHSLDRLSLAEEIQKRAARPLDCFVQVNVSGEESKHGLAPADVLSFVRELAAYDKIRAIGLMTMAPASAPESEIRSVFRELRELRDRAASLHLSAAPCAELSMGMSGDYCIAIEEGATYVRIGTALTGMKGVDPA